MSENSKKRSRDDAQQLNAFTAIDTAISPPFINTVISTSCDDGIEQITEKIRLFYKKHGDFMRTFSENKDYKDRVVDADEIKKQLVNHAEYSESDEGLFVFRKVVTMHHEGSYSFE